MGPYSLVLRTRDGLARESLPHPRCPYLLHDGRHGCVSKVRGGSRPGKFWKVRLLLGRAVSLVRMRSGGESRLGEERARRRVKVPEAC
jgi:hypothetical protein